MWRMWRLLSSSVVHGAVQKGLAGVPDILLCDLGVVQVVHFLDLDFDPCAIYILRLARVGDAGEPMAQLCFFFFFFFLY